MPATVVSPQCGFARNQSEAEYPRLWNCLAGLWSPGVNPRGGVFLRDWGVKANHGTLTTMDPATDWATSSGYSSLDFDGTSDYVDLGTGAGVTFTTAMSISVWFLVNTFAGVNDDYQLLSRDGNTGGRSYTFDVNHPTTGSALNKLRFYVNGGAGSDAIFGSTTSLAAGVIYHAVATYRAGSLNLYLDGKSDATEVTGATNPIPTATASARIGSRQYTGAEGYAPMKLFEAALWSRALSGSEIRTIYQLGPGGIFTPRRRRVVAAQTAAATFQAAWARNSNTLISPTVV